MPKRSGLCARVHYHPHPHRRPTCHCLLNTLHRLQSISPLFILQKIRHMGLTNLLLQSTVVHTRATPVVSPTVTRIWASSPPFPFAVDCASGWCCDCCAGLDARQRTCPTVSEPALSKRAHVCGQQFVAESSPWRTVGGSRHCVLEFSSTIVDFGYRSAAERQKTSDGPPSVSQAFGRVERRH